MAGYQIKVTIEGTKPPVWRRLLIPERITFRQLHEVLQTVFGWEDAHLHAFSFQYSRNEIGDSGDMDYVGSLFRGNAGVGGEAEADDEWGEEKIFIDELLTTGWIRYTYDFGDDWRHKLVLEKELPEYDERYAQVVKFKGENFAEDSGGIWGADEWDEVESEDPDTPYSLEKINAKLKKQKLPILKKAWHAREAEFPVDQKKQEKEKRAQVMEMLKDMADSLQDMMMIAKTKSAPVDEEQKQVEDFYRTQTSKDRLERIETTNGMVELLRRDGILHLRDLAKYLAVSTKDMIPNVSNFSRHIERTLKAHPEYLTLLFSAEQLREYCAFFRNKNQELLEDELLLPAMSLWGLLETQVEQKSKGRILKVAVPADAEELVTWLERQDLEAMDRRHEHIWDRLLALLACYGLAEIPALCRCYQTAFPSSRLTEEELCRYIYLHGSFCRQIITGEFPQKGLESQSSWAALSKGIAHGVDDAWSDSPELIGLEYVTFSKKQIMDMQQGEFARIYPQWNILHATMETCCPYMEEWESAELVSRWYEMVMENAAMPELLKGLEADWKCIDEEHRNLIEHALCRCWSETGIPSLKGNSRKTVAAQIGTSIFEITPKDGYVLESYLEEGKADMLELAAGETEQKAVKEKTEKMSETVWENVPGKASRRTAIMPDPDEPCPCGSGKRWRQCCGGLRKSCTSG